MSETTVALLQVAAFTLRAVKRSEMLDGKTAAEIEKIIARLDELILEGVNRVKTKAQAIADAYDAQN